MGNVIGLIKGDTRNVDNSSVYVASLKFLNRSPAKTGTNSEPDYAAGVDP